MRTDLTEARAQVAKQAGAKALWRSTTPPASLFDRYIHKQLGTGTFPPGGAVRQFFCINTVGF